MSCNPELVSAFLDGELDEVIRDAVISHLMRCETCCQVLGKLSQVRDAFLGPWVLPDPDAFTSLVMTAITGSRGEASSRRDTLLSHPLVRFGAPAALAAAAVSGWMQHAQPVQDAQGGASANSVSDHR
ncbi:MAG: zf-HC2 domain-containing protein [Magnetococcales bacterium]|nr:zf-HC2 domain-containing protein [Magnetococcales bacterium]